MPIVPVLLSGGSGSRLWPRSREEHPKQLLALTGEESMLQATAVRAANLPEVTDPVVVCNEQHCPEIVAQLAAVRVTPTAVIEEAIGRNTATAVAAAAAVASEDGSDPVLLVLPADHVLADEVALKEAVAAGVRHAEAGQLVTLGVVPDRPHTGYGYIRLGEELDAQTHRVARFVEKPDAARAASYLASGEYLWNSGMLMGRATRLLAELREHAPELAAAAATAIDNGHSNGTVLALRRHDLEAIPALSYEHAVLEHSSSTVVVALRGGWSDVGSWAALWELDATAETGNVFIGDVVAERTRNTYVQANSRLVATVGLDDCVVVETKDAVLVAHRSSTEDVKTIVDRLREAGRGQVTTPPVVRRPWGSYEILDTTEGSQTKRLIVEPGAKLSLQRHDHRAEHWVITRGTALVTVDDEEALVRENEAVFVPQGAAHRLENPGRIPLEVVEVQIGSYLGEDDITRLADDYGRI